MRSILNHALSCSILASLAAGCSSAPAGTSATAGTSTAGADQETSPAIPAPGTSVGRDEWRRAMSRRPAPKEGCFTATHPSNDWVEVPCAKAPEVPYLPSRGLRPQTVGNGGDLSAETAGLYWAEGSFPSVTGLTSENDDGSSNSYSLQLNSNIFSSPLCSGAQTPSSCYGWQQFVYEGSGPAFIQYWLIDYGTTCPSGWNTYYSDCWKNSTGSAPVPAQPITNLGQLVLTGSAGGTDTLTLSTGSGQLYSYSQASVLSLNAGWTTAEFNVFGNGGGSEALLNAGTTLVVQVLTDGSSRSTAPDCESAGFTGETNNLNLVANSCEAFGGAAPGIRFTERNAVANAVPLAFQATTGDLWLDQGGVGSDQQLGMKAGTTPSLGLVAGSGVAVAFQANTGNLWLEQNGFGTDQRLGMMAGTSPSLGVLAGGAVAVAFQANTGDLWLEQNGVGTDQHLGMMAGTSPSLAVLPGGKVAIAFQANTGNLWLEQNGVGTDQHLGMMAGTSPSLAVLPGGGLAVAFQANTGSLWLEQNGFGVDQRLGMMTKTSPSLSILTNGTPAVAFQANTGNLWLEENGVGRDQGLGMAAPASPLLASLANAGYQIAFEANTGDLWVEINGVGYDEYLGMSTP